MRDQKLQAWEASKASAPKKMHPASRRAILRAATAAEVLVRAPARPSPAERVPGKWRWHYRALRSLQTRLLQERGELRHAVAEPLEPHSLDEADSATDELDHDLALTQLSAEQDALFEVNEALQRIRSGAYGVCEATGKAIHAARLKAIPWARFTRKIGEQFEKEGEARGVRGSGRIRPSSEEETVENSPDSPNDEALSSVFSLPTRPNAGRKEGQNS